MLSWVGKRPLREVQAFPSQLVERFAPETPDGIVASDVDWTDWPERFDRGGLLFHGDNKEVLAHLLATGFRGKVDLVYIDPPFDSGADYVRKVQLRGASGSARLDGETYTLGEQIQYTDIWANDTYLQFMYERLLLIKELMAPEGTIYLHCDWHKSHHLRSVMDEVFGEDSFRNDIVWQRIYAHNDSGRFGVVHDTLLYYAGGNPIFNRQFRPHSQTYIDSHYGQRDEDGRQFRLVTLSAPGPGPARRFHDRDISPPPGRHWAWSQERIDEGLDTGRVVFAQTGQPNIKQYLDETAGTTVQTIWTDVQPVNPISAEGVDYSTQKPEALLVRILRTSSNPGDLVLDCFIGSGTTAAVAQKLGRRWIGADINKGAIQTTEKRLAAIVREQIEVGGEQLTLDDDAETPPRPAQTSFTVRRVNDYDLQIQHNEALELAVEHLGVQRTRADTFFHGTLGRDLVYIVPFDHPATMLDLEAVVREVEARPGEERDVVVVGLGRELSTVAWLERHNRHAPVNRIGLIDLRTDEKHGRFFEHHPASAQVSFERADGRVRVRVEDVISPSILERLAGQEGILTPRVEDWRSMVDSVAVDTAYDGEVFDVDLIDIPERRSDVVGGTYDLAAPAGDLPAAVRITDMLGEEMLIVESR